MPRKDAWTQAEVDLLFRCAGEGRTQTAAAAIIGRTRGAIQKKCEEVGARFNGRGSPTGSPEWERALSETAALAAQGLFMSEIAARLGCSDSAVEHRIRAYELIAVQWRMAKPIRDKRISEASRERLAAFRRAAPKPPPMSNTERARLGALARAAKDAPLRQERISKACELMRAGDLPSVIAKKIGVSEGWVRNARKWPECAEAWAAGEPVRQRKRKRLLSEGGQNGSVARWGEPKPRVSGDGSRKSRLRYVANQRERKRKGLKHGAIGKAVAAPIPQADCTLAGRCCDYLKRIYTPAYHRVIHGKDHAGTYQVGGLTLSEADMIALAMRKGFGERMAA